jgi:flagellar protein FliS
MERKLKQYQRAQIMGESPLDLILTVYDGAISAYRAAEAAYRAEDHEAGYQQMERARKFVTHLYTTLDHENGGEVADHLARLYAFLISSIDQIEATKDITKIASCLRVISNLRDGWQGIKDQKDEHTDEEPASAVEATAGSFATSG